MTWQPTLPSEQLSGDRWVLDRLGRAEGERRERVIAAGTAGLPSRIERIGRVKGKLNRLEGFVLKELHRRPVPACDSYYCAGCRECLP